MTSQPQDLLQENERLQHELGLARAELQDFTYSVSHDLRASLRHVNAYVQIIKEDLADQNHQSLTSHLDTVSQAAKQMGKQIDGLMELSRLTQLELQLSTVDVGLLVQDAQVTLMQALGERKVEWQLAPDFPPLQCDAALLHQVLTHLLSNALKFTGTRDVAQIKVAWRMSDTGQCIVTVTDNGVGFNPQYTAKLFHAFQRLHGVREFEGLGMGLALTRKIVERHGGTVSATGVVDVGCSVSLSLPLA